MEQVSIPLPGFIVMKDKGDASAGAKLEIGFNPVAGIHCNESLINYAKHYYRNGFNPVAGIHCNESYDLFRIDTVLDGFNPVAGIHCNERYFCDMLLAVISFQSRCRDSL